MSRSTMVLWGAAAILSVAALGVGYDSWPGDPIGPARVPARPVAAKPRAASIGDLVRAPDPDPGPRVPRLAPDERKERREERRADRLANKPEPKLPPEERAKARQEFRLDRQADIDERLDTYAEKAGWSDDKVDQVRGILLDTTDGISQSLERISRGEADWDVERPKLRQFRLDQADKVKAVLGDQFDDFVDGMAFDRFLGQGQEPVRGRLEGQP